MALPLSLAWSLLLFHSFVALHTVCSASEYIASVAQCLPDNTVPKTYRNVTVLQLPWRNWASSQLVISFAAIILAEYLGYAVRLVDVRGKDQSSEVFGDISEHVYDIELELWTLDQSLRDKFAYTGGPVQMMGNLGFSGRSGLYVPGHTIAKIEVLDYYKALRSLPVDQPGFNFIKPGELDPLQVVGNEEGKACAHSWCQPTSSWDVCGNLCKTKALHFTSKYGTGRLEQLLKNHNIPMSVGYYGDVQLFDVVKRLVKEQRDFFFYGYSPDPFLELMRPVYRVSFPDYMNGCDLPETESPYGNTTCDFPAKPVRKLMDSDLHTRAPEVVYLLERIIVSDNDINAMMQLTRAGGGNFDEISAACEFLKQRHEYVLKHWTPKCVRIAEKREGELVFDKEKGICVMLNTNQTCPEGETPDPNTGVCKVCPPGTYAKEGDRSCLECIPGKFSDMAGVTRCETCPHGKFTTGSGSTTCFDCPPGTYDRGPQDAQCAACPEIRLRSGKLIAMKCAGADALPISVPGTYLLDDEFLQCDDASSCLGNNTCTADSFGPLCGTCACTDENCWAKNRRQEPCDECPTLGALLGWGLLAIILVCCYWSALALGLLMGGRKPKGLTSVLVKMLLNHFTFTLILANVADIDKQFSRDDDAGVVAGGSAFPRFADVQCFWQPIFELPMPFIHVIMGYILLPIVVLASGALTILVFLVRGHGHVHVKGDGAAGHAKRLSNTVLSVAVVTAYVLHPVVSQELLTPLNCVRVGSSLRMKDHLAIKCSGEEYLPWFAASFIGVLVYGLSIPALLMLLIYRSRKELHQPSVKSTLGFLYTGYEPRCCFWEGVAMSRKVLVRLAAVVPSPQMQVLALLGLSLVFLSAHMRYRPYDNRQMELLDKVETEMLWIFTLSLLMIAVVQTRRSTNVEYIRQLTWIDPILSVAIVCFQVHFILRVGWEFIKPWVKHHMHRRFPDHQLSRHLHPNDIYLKDGVLDISQLTAQEREFLASSVGECFTRLLCDFPEVTYVHGQTLTCCIEHAMLTVQHHQQLHKNHESQVLQHKESMKKLKIHERIKRLAREKAQDVNKKLANKTQSLSGILSCEVTLEDGFACDIHDLYCHGVMQLFDRPEHRDPLMSQIAQELRVPDRCEDVAVDNSESKDLVISGVPDHGEDLAVDDSESKDLVTSRVVEMVTKEVQTEQWIYTLCCEMEKEKKQSQVEVTSKVDAGLQCDLEAQLMHAHNEKQQTSSIENSLSWHSIKSMEPKREQATQTDHSSLFDVANFSTNGEPPTNFLGQFPEQQPHAHAQMKSSSEACSPEFQGGSMLSTFEESENKNPSWSAEPSFAKPALLLQSPRIRPGSPQSTDRRGCNAASCPNNAAEFFGCGSRKGREAKETPRGSPPLRWEEPSPEPPAQESGSVTLECTPANKSIRCRNVQLTIHHNDERSLRKV